MELFDRGMRWAWMAVGAVAMAVVLGVRDRGTSRERAPVPVIGEWETDPAVWGRIHPREYHTWLMAREPSGVDIGHGPGRTKWSASTDRREDSLRLFAGYSISATGTGSALAPTGHPVSCQVCHDPQSMDLRLSQPAFLDALSRRGILAAGLSHQEMRSYVCAQCHVTRFQGREDMKPLIPFTADGITDAFDHGGHTDWNHAASGAPLLKVRHPEFELWGTGIHARRGVSCPDCHMPYRSEGTLRITDHRMKSPLLDVSSACATCHRWGEREIQARVEAIQDTTMDLQRRASQALLAAHRAAAEAGRAGAAEDQLKAIRALLRQAQGRWDFIASENSAGFHSPQEAAKTLSVAIDLARQAEIRARRASRKNATSRTGSG